MKFIKKLLVVVVGVLAVLVIVGLFLPQEVEVERKVTINAPVQKIYPMINDFRQFNTWSPWARNDPDMEYRFEGPESGVGSKMYWTSDQFGSGSQEILENEEHAFVKTRLDFGPQGQAYAHFTLSPEENGTSVTWGFTSDFGMDLVGRYMGLLFEGWIGADYEEGLANLKKLVEMNE